MKPFLRKSFFRKYCAFFAVFSLGWLPHSLWASPNNDTDNHLPRGQTSLSENYQDWRVICRKFGDKSRCEVVQEEFDDVNQMKVMTFEVTPGNFSSLKGVIVVPLGVDVSRHISLMLDGGGMSVDLPFSTCVVTGCLVPLRLDSHEANRLENAHNIVVRFVTMSGRTIYVALSERGLKAALTRMRKLSA